MASGVTYQALERLTNMPTRGGEQGDRIAGQYYYDVDFTGGIISNVNLVNCTFSPPVSGGGGITSEQLISSGSTATAILGQVILMNSASGLAKAIVAPTATGSKEIISVIDMRGDAGNGTATITFAPLTGSVIGNSVGQNQVYTNYGTGTWLDTSQGWVRVG